MAYVRRHVYGTGEVVAVAELSRPPVLKTFRLGLPSLSTFVTAESKEAALAKLAESLEEVP
jgi:hypothetical protein